MQKVANFFPRFFKELPNDEAVRLRFFRSLWPQIVGADLAKNAAPVKLRGKMLTLEVRNQVWRNQLEGMVPDLVDAVNQFWGDKVVRGVIFELARES